MVVAGGGVAAVEAVLALRALAGQQLEIELVAEESELEYKPLAVVEPFGFPRPGRLLLGRLEQTHRVRLRRDRLAAVDAGAHVVTLRSGEELNFDALVVATGARRQAWLPGALTFGGHEDVDAYRVLLDELAAGTVERVLFAVAPGPSWTLPLYELALLTAAWLAERGIIGVELSLATPTTEPLALFGPAAASIVRNLLSDRGIRLLPGAQVQSLPDRQTALVGSTPIAVDRVVTLATLVADSVPGLPSDTDGFIPTDEHSAVVGLPDVYAAGDVTAFPVKQGSLAAQQADAAAAVIAARLGRPVQAEPFLPILHAVLLTGVAAAYLRANISGHEPAASAASFTPLWWPPEKIAGRFLAPYLAEQHQLAEIPPTAAPDEQRQLALRFAHDDAERGDYTSARAWLDVLERLDGISQRDQAQLRER